MCVKGEASTNYLVNHQQKNKSNDTYTEIFGSDTTLIKNVR
jgi:hypothetical protein